MLAETIKEVEKLQAAQQITSTLLLASSVNTMSSNNDRCFQCQEVGHMACYCPNIHCYDFNNDRHVAMDCPDNIPPSGTPSHHRTNNRDRNKRSSSRRPSHTRHLHHNHRDRSRFSCSCSCPCNHSYQSSSQHEHCRNCSRSSHRYSHCSSSCNKSSSSHRYCKDTPHTRPSHRNTSRDDSRSRHNTKHCHYKPARGSSSTTQASSQKYEDKRQRPKQVSIDNPLSDYYSLEESESDSEDDLN